MRDLNHGILRRRTAVFSSSVVILLLLAAVVVAAKADYNISISSGNATVDITGDFVQGVPLQNVNGTSIFAGIPAFQTRLQGANASILTAAVTRAILANSPSAEVGNVKFAAASNSTLMHYELSFTVSNIVSVTNGQETLDLSWRSFTIQDDFGANGVSINRVVPNYVQNSILTLAQATAPNSGIQVVRTWYLDTRATLADRIPLRVRNLALFNFSSLDQPLSQWSVQRDFSRSQVTLQSRSGFNLTLVTRVTEAEITESVASDMVNNFNVRIQAPLPLRIDDNQLVFDTGQNNWIAQLALAAVGGCLALLIGAYVVERRVRPPLRPLPKKGKR